MGARESTCVNNQAECKVEKADTSAKNIRHRKKCKGNTGNKHTAHCGKNLKTEGNNDKCSNSPSMAPSSIRRQRLKELEEERPQLTEKQVDLITTSWHILQSDLAAVGSDMFVRTFEQYPDVRGAFGPFRSLSPEDERYSRELRDHGLRVLGTVEAILSNWKDPDAIVDHLHELGLKHITFNAKVDYMDILGQQFLFAIEPELKEQWTTELEQAWADLFRYMTHLMKEAMMM